MNLTEEFNLAIDALCKVPFPGVDKDIPPKEAREQQTKMCLRLVATLERYLDPRYDRKDPRFDPTLYHEPRPVPIGAWRVPDPELRAKYRKDIELNEAKGRKCWFQTLLRDADERLKRHAGYFLPRFYSPSAEDQAELNKLLEQSGISAARKTKIKQLPFKGRPSKP